MDRPTIIIAKYGLKTEIAKLLSVNRRTVERALSGTHTLTEKALKIRKLALDMGAVEVK